MFGFKKYTIDPTAKKLLTEVLMKDGISFLSGTSIKMITEGVFDYPAAEVLEQYHIKVVDFRAPKDGEYFITMEGKIGVCLTSVNMSYLGGRRYILENA